MIFHPGWRKFLRRGQEGWIKVTPEDADDIWTLYNVIAAGDEVEAMTLRYGAGVSLCLTSGVQPGAAGKLEWGCRGQPQGQGAAGGGR